MAYDPLASRISRIFAREIEKLVDEIYWVDSRLAELGDDDESMAERIILNALRKHLVNDLRALGGFSGDPYLFDEMRGEQVYPASIGQAEAGT